MINYRVYFNNVFLDSLRPLIDLEWQERGWGGLDLPEKYVGFDEIIMGFTEACDVIFSKPEKYNLNKTKLTKLQELYDMVDKYDSSLERPEDEKQIIKDPEWHEIREFAKAVYDDLKPVK